jgi:intraflagellar transport protein 22
MSNRLKVIVVGPCGSGKTLIANYLMGQSELLTTERYDPTVGARILENDINFGNMTMSVELWDVSGDNKCVSSLSTFSVSN